MPYSYFQSSRKFAKYLNHVFNHKHCRFTLESNKNRKRFEYLDNSITNLFKRHVEIGRLISNLKHSKTSHTEENKENKGCCGHTDEKDLVLTERALEKIKFEIETYEVVLFMKGNARKPSCGFSKQALDILKALKIDTIRTVNILEDEELRNGLKVYSKYPNFPQLYIRGKFVGGLDKITEMFSNGTLEKLIRDE